MPARPKKEPARSMFDVTWILDEIKGVFEEVKSLRREARGQVADFEKAESGIRNCVIEECMKLRADLMDRIDAYSPRIQNLETSVYGLKDDPNNPGVVNLVKAIGEKNAIYDNFMDTHEELTKLQAAKQEGVRTGIKNAGISREFMLKVCKIIVGGLGIILTSTVIQAIIEAVFKAGGKP